MLEMCSYDIFYCTVQYSNHKFKTCSDYGVVGPLSRRGSRVVMSFSKVVNSTDNYVN